MQKKNFPILLILSAFTCIWIYWIAKVFAGGTFLPVEIDETIHYYSGKTFAENGSVQYTLCYAGNISKILSCNWYGPVYPILYGLLWLTGSGAAYLLFNLLLIGGIFYTGAYLYLKKESLLGLVCIWAAINPLSLAYLARFFPLFIYLLLAVILVAFIHRMDRKPGIKVISGYLILCLLACCFRQNFIVWTIAVLPYLPALKVRERFLVIGEVAFIGISCLLLYRAFCAPAEIPYGFHSFEITLYNLETNFRLLGTYLPFIGNPWYLAYYIVLLCPLIFIRSFNNKKVLVAFLIIVAHLLLSITFYTMLPHFFVRVSLPVVVIFIYGLFSLKEVKAYYRFAFTALTILGSLLSIQWTTQQFEVSQESVLAIQQPMYKKLKEKIEQISRSTENPVFYFDRKIMDINLLNALPYSYNRKQIHYVSDSKELVTSSTEYPKVKITHIISDHRLLLHSTELSSIKDHFHIYSVEKLPAGK